jgi:uncharacterized membrane protein
MQTVLLLAAVGTTAAMLASVATYFLRGPRKTERRGQFETFAALTLLNFLLFWWIAVLSGGSALNGRIIGDRYFVGDHGRYTQVSLGFWLFSYIHSLTVVASFVVLFILQACRIFTGRDSSEKDGDRLHPRGRGTV